MKRRPRLSPEQAAREVVQALREAGHQALFAGGCVRDQLLGRPANDYDVATSALPGQVQAVFKRTRPQGEQFGVVVVQLGGRETEVATFRADGEYVDGRRPEEVTYGVEPALDAARRDFTINGLFFDPVAGEVHDFVEGTADLRLGVIRAIGDPGARFDEDQLRILRAPRFAAQLGFRIEERTAEEARARAAMIRTAEVSAERIHTELGKILDSPGRADGLRLCHTLGIIPVVLPEAEDPLRVCRTLRALGAGPLPRPLLWAAVLQASPPDQADAALRRLKASNKDRQGAVALLTALPRVRGLAGLGIAEQKKLLRDHGEDLDRLLAATSVAGDGDLEPSRLLALRRAAFDEDPSPASPSARPLVMGADLRAAGLTPGPLFGKLLPRVLDAQLEGRLRDRDEALAYALSLADEPG